MSLLGDRKCDRPGFSSFLEPFFFSFHKEKKKVTKRFEIKEKLESKSKCSLLDKFQFEEK
jgi:hypothetical protein